MAAEQFVGAWRLVRYDYWRANGERRCPMGEHPEGLLAYTADGLMSGQVMRRGRPEFARGLLTLGSDEEIRQAFTGYIAYFGRYAVDASAHTITHYVAGSWYPNYVGSEQVRHYSFDDDGRLTLRTPPREHGTERRTGALVWERIPAAPS